MYFTLVSTIFNMSGLVVSDKQTQAKGESNFDKIRKVILKIHLI